MTVLNPHSKRLQIAQGIFAERVLIMDPDYQYHAVQKKEKATKTIEKEDHISVPLPTIGKDELDCFDLFVTRDKKRILVLGPDEFPKEKAHFIFRLDLEDLSLLGQFMRRNGVLNTLYIIKPQSW